MAKLLCIREPVITQRTEKEKEDRKDVQTSESMRSHPREKVETEGEPT